MKTTILFAVSLSALAGCSFAARSPEMYRDDTTAVLQSKNDEIRACYDDVLRAQPGAGGSVTVQFEVADDGADNAGQIQNVQVDKANTTAPEPVADCVAKNITGLPLNPPDKRKGEATYVYEFSAPPPPAAPPIPAMGSPRS
jgi:hypothetical protein